METTDQLRGLLNKHFPNEVCWIAGDAVRDVLTGQPVKDVDVFFLDGTDVKAVAARFDDGFNYPVETPHAYKVEVDGVILDIVKETASSVTDTIQHFDFTMCGVGLTRFGDIVRLPDFERDLEAKVLRVHHITSPLNTLRRVQKYVKRVFTLDFEELVKIMEGLRKMDDLDFTVEIAALRACGGNPS